MKSRFETPTIYIVFGITGDLFKRKILKSIYNLYTKNSLPKKFVIFGFGRRDWTNKDLRKYLKSVFDKQDETFIKHFFYIKGNFDNLNSYKNLSEQLGMVDNKWNYCSNKMFHLAVPPMYYETIIKNLKKSKLTKICSDAEGWTRVIIEKPFGKNAATAENLDKTLIKYFKENQIYRLDHYLGKEILQNIIFFRFSNNIFENSWNNKFIEKINIVSLESNLVDTRGNYYDGVGELRDMGQSHLLQMLALITIQNPNSLNGDEVRNKRANILKDLKTFTKSNVEKNTIRAQYINYTKAAGVEKNSKTETFFSLKTEIDNNTWNGVEINLTSGKGTVKKSKSYIDVIFKHPSDCYCPINSNHEFKNKIRFELKPANEISITTWYKKPGLEFDIEKKLVQIPLASTNGSSEYEKLIYDCIKGDQTLFVSSEEVKQMWDFVDPMIKEWGSGKTPLLKYKKGQTPKFFS